MKLCTLLLLTALAVPAAAAPVHVVLQSAPSVSPNADGFFSLASVAALTGGAPAQRTRLAGILVGRAPLSGETRCLTAGDLALKLRQAGCDPDKDVVLDGAKEAQVTTGGALLAAPSGLAAPTEKGAASSAPIVQGPLLRPGTPITILIQSGPLTITAPGIARDSGGAGDTIHVHREGVMTDLIVTVVDAQTVRLEI